MRAERHLGGGKAEGIRVDGSRARPDPPLAIVDWAVIGHLYTRVRHANQRYWGCTEDGWIELAPYKGMAGSGGVISYRGEFWAVKADESTSLMDNAPVKVMVLPVSLASAAPAAPKMMWAHLKDALLYLCNHPAGFHPHEYLIDLHNSRPKTVVVANQDAIVLQCADTTVHLLDLAPAQVNALLDATAASDWAVPRGFVPVAVEWDRPKRLYHFDTPDDEIKKISEAALLPLLAPKAEPPPAPNHIGSLWEYLEEQNRGKNDAQQANLHWSLDSSDSLPSPRSSDDGSAFRDFDELTDEQIARLGLEDVKLIAQADEEPIPDFLLETEARADSPYYQLERVYVAKPEEECTICYNEFAPTTTRARLICFCVYHTHCIDDWFKKKKSPCCPTHLDAYAEAITQGIIPPPPPAK